MSSRRNFIQNAAVVLSASAINPLNTQAQLLNAPQAFKKDFLPLAMAGYTFVNYSIEQTIAMMNRVGITQLSVKDFHLPLNSTPQKINEVKATFAKGGIDIYTVGVIYMKTKEEVDRAFEYARNVGVAMIVGVPGYDLLQYTEQKVKDTGIRMAIHNHGPEDKLYPGPKDVYDRIKNMDSRMGLCLDIGHAFRAGADLHKALKAYAPRIFDLHMKDVTAAKADAKVIEIGRGAIDFRSVIHTLRSIKYVGKCSIEYEKDMKDALPGIAESAGYLRGVMS